MLNIGGMEIVAILVVALLVLGPDKLPGLMRTVGKAARELRKASTEFQRSINTEIAENEASGPVTPAEPATAIPVPPQPVQDDAAGIRNNSAAAESTTADGAPGKSGTPRILPARRQVRAAAKPLLRKKTALPRNPDDDTAAGAS